MKRLSLFTSIFIFTLFYFPIYGQQQNGLIEDKAMMEEMRIGIDKMYNLEFAEARARFAKLKGKYSESPAVPFLEALVVYWENIPIDFSSSAYNRHVKLLKQSITKAEARLDKDDEDIEGVFFAMSARSYLMLYYAEQGKYSDAVSGAKEAYALMKQSFDLVDKFDEFKFPTGLYNYYRVKYPEIHPVYKPFAWFFMSGDIKKGLADMNYAADNCIFVRREALTYLTNIYLSYEKVPSKSIKYAERLLASAPNNTLFKAFLGESYLNSGYFAKASPIAEELVRQSNYSYQTIGYIYKGWIEEKQNKNHEAAKKHYLLAHERLQKEGNRLYLHKPYLYYGLNRIYKAEGNNKKAEEYLDMID